jgi:hypothetical protein
MENFTWGPNDDKHCLAHLLCDATHLYHFLVAAVGVVVVVEGGGGGCVWIFPRSHDPENLLVQLPYWNYFLATENFQ